MISSHLAGILPTLTPEKTILSEKCLGGGRNVRAYLNERVKGVADRFPQPSVFLGVLALSERIEKPCALVERRFKSDLGKEGIKGLGVVA